MYGPSKPCKSLLFIMDLWKIDFFSYGKTKICSKY